MVEIIWNSHRCCNLGVYIWGSHNCEISYSLLTSLADDDRDVVATHVLRNRYSTPFMNYTGKHVVWPMLLLQKFWVVWILLLIHLLGLMIHKGPVWGDDGGDCHSLEHFEPGDCA